MGRIARAVTDVSSRLARELERVRRADGWLNLYTGLGGSKDKTVQAQVKVVNPVAPTVLEHLYHGDDLAATIVDAPVDDALRQGVRWADDGVSLAVERWGVLDVIGEAARWGRLYGIGAVVLESSEFDPTDAPWRGGLTRLRVVDRHDLSIETYGLDGRPEIYRISDRNGGQRLYHYSRVVAFGGVPTSRNMRDRNAGFELSVLQRPYDLIRDMAESWRSAIHLAGDASQSVFAIKGLMDMIAEGQGGVVTERMEIVDLARTIARSVVIDAEDESFTNTGAQNLGQVPVFMQMVFQRLAGAARMPVTRLFGMSPAGLNATGESDIRTWYDSVAAWRTAELEPRLITIVDAVLEAEGLSLDYDFEWPSLWQPTDKERAELDKLRADTWAVWVSSGLLDPEEIAEVEFAGTPYEELIAKREQTFEFTQPERSEEVPDAPTTTPAEGAAPADSEAD